MSLAAWLRLTLTRGIGGETQRKLLAAFSLPEHIFAASDSSLRSVIGERARFFAEDDCSEAIAAALTWSKQPGCHIVTLADAEYPQALLQIADPPTLFYARGRLELLNRPALAVVGSRNATPQGIQTAESFSRSLAQQGLVIVSGLALGIDAAAHRGALAADGDSIAVIGTGADRIYPARNRDLALALAEHGLIISEFPLGTPAIAANFPRRNRLISGLARGVLVVEAAPQSGSLITARQAAEQGREVFAIPGSIHSPVARGCHQLIKEGAKLVQTAEDVLEDLRWQHSITMTVPSSNTDETDPVLSALGHDPCNLDELAERSGLAAAELLPRLLEFELDGTIAKLPGNRFQRLNSPGNKFTQQ